MSTAKSATKHSCASLGRLVRVSGNRKISIRTAAGYRLGASKNNDDAAATVDNLERAIAARKMVGPNEEALSEHMVTLLRSLANAYRRVGRIADANECQARASKRGLCENTKEVEQFLGLYRGTMEEAGGLEVAVDVQVSLPPPDDSNLVGAKLIAECVVHSGGGMSADLKNAENTAGNDSVTLEAYNAE